MIRRLVHAYSADQLPAMTRPSYQRELITSMTMPAAVALVEGAVVGVLAEKVFGVSEIQLAAIVAAPNFANLTSIVWARLARGRRKVRSIVVLMAAVAASVAAIAALPINTLGTWGLTGLVILSRCLLAGIITLRSTVWRHNYPRHVRNRATARLATIASVLLFVVPLIGSLLLDGSQQWFRLLYPLGALTATVGIVSFSGIRLRGERALLDYERRPDVRPQRHGDAAGIYEYDDHAPNPSMWTVLRRDPLFGQYMLWQFFAGLSVMMLEPVAIKLLAERTTGLRFDFAITTALTQCIPALTVVLTLPLWARYLDRVHIARFRVFHSLLWVVADLLMYTAALWTGSLIGALWVFAVGRLVLGMARGGGVLAWNLGHNDFASRRMVAVYMGIHVTLTGVRGAVAPFLGMALYVGWDPIGMLGVTLPGYEGIGAHVFAVSAVLSFIAAAGFWQLDKLISARGDQPTPLD